MIVAGIQMDIAWENPPANFRRVESMTPAAMGRMDHPGETWPVQVHGSADGTPDLLVLPEMFATGFSMNAEKVAAFAEETRAFLVALARKWEVHVLGGYAEPGRERPANACSIFSPAGEEILHFRKLHPFSMAGEDESYEGGDSLPTVKVNGVRVTPLICYDLRFPEPFRPAAAATDLYCVIANWPHMRRVAWSTLLRARAIENQAYVLGVNRVGEAGGKPHAGDSALIDPMGRVVVDSAEYEEGIVKGRADPDEVAEVRRSLDFLTDRKPDLYRMLEEDRIT
jgi:predicted amidohydrolase